jgi:hypothetical protein
MSKELKSDFVIVRLSTVRGCRAEARRFDLGAGPSRRQRIAEGRVCKVNPSAVEIRAVQVRK